MSLRQRLENLTVSRKLLAALLVLLATVLLVANLAFISAAYWIARENTAPLALHSLGRLIPTPALSREALASPAQAAALLDSLELFVLRLQCPRFAANRITDICTETHCETDSKKGNQHG